MPSYLAEITSLIKATAIVGYIAVAVVYFVLAAILTGIVRKIGAKTDWKRRSREEILKGIQ